MRPATRRTKASNVVRGHQYLADPVRSQGKRTAAEKEAAAKAYISWLGSVAHGSTWVISARCAPLRFFAVVADRWTQRAFRRFS